MATKTNKAEIITFKADASLLASMAGIANRSEFIRGAILAALDSACPLCMGMGMLTPQQKMHWDAFAGSHAVRVCSECHERHLTCSRDSASGAS